MATSSPAFMVRTTRHFEARARERLRGVALTGELLQRELADAPFTPDDTDGRTYVTTRVLAGRLVVLVGAAEPGLLTLVTIFEPSDAWRRRYAGRPTLSGRLLTAAS